MKNVIYGNWNAERFKYTNDYFDRSRGRNSTKIAKISDKEVSYIPSMYYVGKTNDAKLAYELGK